MNFPEIKPIKRQTEKVSELMGMDVRPVIADGNFSYLKNLSNEEYPTFIPMRKMNIDLFDTSNTNRVYSFAQADRMYLVKREITQNDFDYIATIYVCDMNHVVLNQYSVSLGEDDPGEAKLSTTVIGNKIVIFPDKVVYDCIENKFSDIEYQWHPNYTIPLATDLGKKTYTINFAKPTSIVKGNEYAINVPFDISQEILKEAYENDVNLMLEDYKITVTYNTSSTYVPSTTGVMGSGIRIVPSSNPVRYEASYTFTFLSNISTKSVKKIEFEGDAKIGVVTVSDVYARISLLDTNGKEITNIVENDVAPDDPKSGDYWIDTSVTPSVMKIWDENAGRWVQVISSNYKVQIFREMVPETFNVYDTVNFHTLSEDIFHEEHMEEDLEGEWTIQKISDDRRYFVISAVLPKIEYKFFNGFYISRDCPDLKYICVNDNRVWGCGEHDNTIYASKLGDPYNWYGYEDLSTDSYALEVASVGDFTGIIALNSSVYVFKDTCIHRLYGTKPQNYSLKTFENVKGMSDANGNNITQFSGYIYYCTEEGVYAFEGSNIPVKISDPIGNVKFEGIGFYGDYLIFANPDYAYDIKHGTWKKYVNLDQEERLRSNVFSNVNGVYMVRGNEQYSLVSIEKEDDTDYLDAEAITGNIGIMYDNHKYLSRLIVRAELNENSKLTISVSYDDGEFLKVYEKTGKQNNEAVELPIIPRRCDHMKIKFETTGFVRLYSYTKEFEGGSMYGKH